MALAKKDALFWLKPFHIIPNFNPPAKAGGNSATSKQIDSILDTIDHLKTSEFSSIPKGKSLEKQLFRLDHILEEEQLHYKKVI